VFDVFLAIMRASQRRLLLRPARHFLRLRRGFGAGIAASEVEAVGGELGGWGVFARLFE
jgi:hypothetical protein